MRDPLPSLPIMAATRLQLDLLLNDSVIDLKGVADVILADAGATLQILRLIGEEFSNDDDRPKRIEDCIVSLSMARCYQTICASQISHSGPHVAEWQHCRRIAECARELAKNLDGFSPDEAYLVGLLCRLGTFPRLLGWKDDSSSSGESEALGEMLACHWNLPHYVVVAIQEQRESENSSKWKNILMLAHQMVEQSAAY
jgi:HD-like signal output (HDOD) protein